MQGAGAGTPICTTTIANPATSEPKARTQASYRSAGRPPAEVSPDVHFFSPQTYRLSHRKGVADEELAKREAERAKKRQLEEDDDDDGPSHRKSEPKRQRSGSSGSVSSASSRPASPPARRRAASFFSRSPSPIAPQTRRSRDASPPVRKERDRVYDRGSDGSPESVRSRGLEDRARTASHRDLSPGRETSQRIGFERESSVSTGGHGARGGRRGPRGQGRLEHSRSPTPSAQRNRSRSRSSDQGSTRRYRERNNEVTVPAVRQPAQSAQPPRERSLSPFSKRLALTQSMNTGR